MSERNGKSAFLTSIISVGVLILIAGIPFGYSMHGRVVGIEAAQNTTNKRLEGIEQGLKTTPRWLEEKLERLEKSIEKGRDTK